RMRPDQDPRFAGRASGSAKRTDPPPNKVRLLRGDEMRRARVQHDRPVDVEPDLAAKVLAAAFHAPLEPVVVRRSARDSDAVGGAPGEGGGLGLSQRVPT